MSPDVSWFAFYNDNAKDLICFFLLPKSVRDYVNLIDIDSDFHYIAPFPCALKVDRTLPAFLEFMESSYLNRPQDFLKSVRDGFSATNSIMTLAVTYIPQFFGGLTSFEIHEKLIKDLFTYELKSLNDISLRTALHLLVPEKTHHEIFMKAKGDDVDPCKFRSLEWNYDDSILDFSLDQLWHFTKRDLSSYCLALMAAVLAQHPAVTFIALSLRPQILNYRARSIPQSGRVGSGIGFAPYLDRKLLGDGVIVAVADTGLDDTSCYFRDPIGIIPKTPMSTPHPVLTQRKVIQYAYSTGGDGLDEFQGHGTHVCGTVAGNSYDINPSDSIYSSQGQFSGVAPNAKIAFLDVSNSPEEISIPATTALYTLGYNAGAKIHTNSWGSQFVCNKCGYYYGSDTDKFLYNHPDFLIFFAAGNFGQTGNFSLSREGSIKNVLSIGAAETTLASSNIDYIAYFSSQGPTYDRRIKPDIVASGAALQSASSNGASGPTCNTVVRTGTSMASPAAAGVAALIMQYFADSYFWKAVCNAAYPSCVAFTPSGVLTKAVILHSAVGMKAFEGLVATVFLKTPPDNFQGYGRVSMNAVLPLPGVNSFDMFVADLVSLPSLGLHSYQVTVTSGAVPLTVTLCWYDPPNVGAPSKALLHDLDLTLVSPAGGVYYGNGGGSSDSRNSNEKVSITGPPVGAWQVKVTSRVLTYAPTQQYSIVITCVGGTTSF